MESMPYTWVGLSPRGDHWRGREKDKELVHHSREGLITTRRGHQIEGVSSFFPMS